MRKKLLISLMIMTVMLFSFAGSAFAYYHVGYDVSPPIMTGASSYITYYNPSVTQSTAAYTMIWDGLDVNKYAQVGWDKEYNYNVPQYFTEWSNSSTDYSFQAFGTFSGSHTYKVTKDYMGYFRFYVDSTEKFNKSMSWTPRKAQYMTETYSTNDRMPGSSSAHAQVSNIQFYDGTIWQTPGSASGVDSGSSYYQFSYPSTSYFQVWDTRN